MRVRRGFFLVVGILSVLLLDIALNSLMLKQELFTPWVVLPFLVGLGLGFVWVVLSLTRLAGEAEAGRAAYGANVLLSSVVFLGICVTLFAFARHWKASWDLTREGRRDLAPQTIQILESLDRDVDVYGLFIAPAASAASVAEEKTRRFLERCQWYTNHLKVEFLDPEADPLVIKQLELPRLALEGTVMLKCGKNRRVITLSGVTPRLEERDFTNALINVIRDAQPKVYFLTGHGERDIDDPDPRNGCTILREELDRESYQVERLGFDRANPEAPSDCRILVINGQNRDLNPMEVIALQEYLAEGGRLLLLLDLWIVPQAPGVRTVENLRPWLTQRYGIRIGEDIVLSRRGKAELTLVPSFGPDAGESPYRGSFNDAHPITRGLTHNMVLTGARSVSLAEKMPEGVVGEELLRSPPDCWAETNLKLLFESEERTARPDPDERTGSIPLAVAVTARREGLSGDAGPGEDARIVVIGNREFASNGKIVGQPQHINLIMNTFAWLSESEELIGLRPTGREDPPIVLSPTQEQVIAWIASLGILHVVILAGLATYVVRRRYS